jgi:hypothetical protein
LFCEDAVRRAYNLRYRVCEPHLRAAAVQHQGQQQRFCQVRPRLRNTAVVASMRR